MANKTSLEDILAQAQQALKAERWGPARFLYQKARKIDPEHPDVQAGLRKLNEILNEALQEAEQSLRDGKWARARRAYQRALKIAPDNTQAQEGLRYLDRLEQTDPKIQELIQQGDEYFKAGDYQEAFNAYQDAFDLGGEKGILRYHDQLGPKIASARDLAAWQRRVAETLKKVERHKRNRETWGTALQEIDKLLQELPTESLYGELAEPLRQAQQEMEKIAGAEVFYQEAVKEHKAQNYERCSQLVAKVPPGAPDYQQAQLLLEDVEDFLNHYIRPALKRAQEFYEKEEWANAFAELDDLKNKYKDSKVWRPLWMKVGLGYGRQELERGREDNSQARFEQAKMHFQQAYQAFDKVLEVHPDHMTVCPLRQEAQDLIQITIWERQAQDWWDQGRREEACAVLEKARNLIEKARDEGREYPTVAAVVDTMYTIVSREIEQIRQDENRLKDGLRLWEDKRLSQAADRFRETLSALLPEHQRQAAEHLNNVEAKLRTFRDKMQEGRESADPFRAVEAFRAARDIWPNGPNMLQELEQALVKAGLSARDAGRKPQAIQYLQDALKINPDNETAQRELRGFEQRPLIKAELADIEGQVDSLLVSQQDIQASEIETLTNKLEKLYGRAQPYPDLQKKVADPLSRTTSLLERWRTLERELKQAESFKAEGRWEEATDRLGQALAGMDAPPHSLTLKLGDWQAVVQAIQAAQETGREALKKAQEGYQQAPEKGDFGAPLRALDSAESAFEGLERAVTTAQGGRWPQDLLSLRKQVKDLGLRIKAARDAFQASKATDGLVSIRQPLEQWSGDPTLRAVQADLAKRAKEEVDRLVQDAHLALDSSDLPNAVDLLRQANELRPDDAEIAKIYRAVRRRRDLLNKLRQIEEAAQDKKERGSITDAREEWRKGLQLFLTPAVALASEAKDILNKLIELAEQEDRLALGLDDYWLQAEEMLAQLGRMSSQSWEANEASRLAWDWAQVTRDQSLAGVVSSRTQYRLYREAYRAAQTYLSRHATDEEARRQLANTEENLLNQVGESTSKRLRSARKAKERGDYETALNELKELLGYYKETDDAFPNLLSQVDEIEQIRQGAEELEREVQELQQVQEEILPDLETADEAFKDNRLTEAQELLKALPRLGIAPRLARRIQELEGDIANARRKSQTTKLRQALSQAQSDLRKAQTVQDVEQIQQDLEDLAQEIDLFELPEEKSRYDQVVGEVSQTLKAMIEGQSQEKEARGYIKKGKYQEAVAALEAVLKVTREPEKRSELQGELSKIRALADKQRETAQARERGEQFFLTGRYYEARQELEKAISRSDVSDEMEDLIQACRAGILWESAKWSLEQQEDEKDIDRKNLLLQDALLEVEKALNLIKNNLEADDIRLGLDTLKGKIELRTVYIKEKVEEARKRAELEREKQEKEERAQRQRLEKEQRERSKIEQEINAAIRQAQEALNNKDVNRAKEAILPALDKAPDHEGAQRIHAEILIAERARNTLEEAQKLMEAGDYGKARSRVKGIIPDLEDKLSVRVYLQKAESLLHDVEAGYEANNLLLLAENKAERKEFQQARDILEKAITTGGASNERIAQVQQKLDHLEKEWESEIIDPITEHQRKHEHEDAYTLCEQALSQVASSDFRKRLENLKASIVTMWVQESLDELRQEFHQAPKDQARMEKIAVGLDRLTALEPAEHLGKEIEELSTRVNSRRLELMLAKVQDMADREDWDQALDQLEKIKIETDRLSLENIAQRVMHLRLDLETGRREANTAQQRAQRDELLSEAQRLWQTPQGRADLERVRALADLVLEIPLFERDREAQSLQREVQREIETFDRTVAIIQKGRDEIYNGRYKEAEEALSLASVSRLLQKDHEQLATLTRILVQAEAEQIGSNWEAALRGYQQAVEIEEQLAPKLRNDQEFCRAKIMEQILIQAQQHLEAIPPKPDEARDLLEEARSQGWVVPTLQTKVDRLLKWCQSQEHVVRAAEILKGDEDPGQALEELRKARKMLPTDQDKAAIRHWEVLAQTLLAWPHDLDEVEARLQEIEATPLGNLGRVHRLRQDLEQKRREDASRQKKQERQARLSIKIREKIHKALNASPPQHKEAVEAARQASQELEDKSLTADLVQAVQDHLEASISVARNSDDYDQAIHLARLFQKLKPKDEKPRSLIKELSAERRRRLAQAIQDAQQAIQARDATSAERNLQLATKIAVREGDPALDAVRQELEALKSVKLEITPLLRQAAQAAREERWPSVGDLLQRAKDLDPAYPGVAKMIQGIQGQLLAKAQSALETEQFSQAIDLCRWGLKLGSHRDLGVLQQTIDKQWTEYKDILRAQIQQALDIWDLATARQALDKAQTLAPDDASFRSLQNRVRQMETQCAELPGQMELGGAALRSRDYAQAQKVFEQITATIPTFREAQRWLLYTTNLERGIRLCQQQGRWEALPDIPKRLREAERQLCMTPGEQLPVLLSTLAEERKQAVWNVQQLRSLADGMIALYQQYESFMAQAQVLQARDLLSRIEEARQAILRRHESPTTPPPGYTAECAPIPTETDAYQPQPLAMPMSGWEPPTTKATDQGEDKPTTDQEVTIPITEAADYGSLKPPTATEQAVDDFPRCQEPDTGYDSESPETEPQPDRPWEPSIETGPVGDDLLEMTDKDETVAAMIEETPEEYLDTGRDAMSREDDPVLKRETRIPSQELTPDQQPDPEDAQESEEEDFQDWASMSWEVDSLPAYEE